MPSDSVFDGDKENMSSKAHGKLVAAFSVEDKHFQEDIFGWINSIEDSRLYAGLKRLTDEQLELLYCIYEKGMTFTEFARAKDISKGAVSQRHRVIINKLKKFL
jgi:DNA-directed RNA polymerase specialized sigma subunit